MIIVGTTSAPAVTRCVTSSPVAACTVVGADLALDTEIDVFTVPAPERVATRVGEGEASREPVTDAGDPGFIEHHDVRVRERVAEHSDLRAVVVRESARTAAELPERLTLRRVQVMPT